MGNARDNKICTTRHCGFAAFVCKKSKGFMLAYLTLALFLFALFALVIGGTIHGSRFPAEKR